MGSTFTVTLPVRAIGAARSPLRNSMGDTFLHRDRLRAIEIVLVDDDVESRKMVAAVLRAAGANVTALDSAAAGLQAVSERRPDIVITDIGMPEMDGYAFTRALRQQNVDLKIVALSAFPAPQGAKEFDAYLTKPVDPFHLVDDIARVVLRPTG